MFLSILAAYFVFGFVIASVMYRYDLDYTRTYDNFGIIMWLWPAALVAVTVDSICERASNYPSPLKKYKQWLTK